MIDVTNVPQKVNKIYFSAKVLNAFSQWQKQQLILARVLHINEYADFITQICWEDLRSQFSRVSKRAERRF